MSKVLALRCAALRISSQLKPVCQQYLTLFPKNNLTLFPKKFYLNYLSTEVLNHE